MLKTAHISASVTTLADYMFAYDFMLETITFEEGSGITTIPASFAEDCISLTNVTLPSSVETIETRAFNHVAFSYFVMPENLTTIKQYAFGLFNPAEIDKFFKDSVFTYINSDFYMYIFDIIRTQYVKILQAVYVFNENLTTIHSQAFISPVSALANGNFWLSFFPNENVKTVFQAMFATYEYDEKKLLLAKCQQKLKKNILGCLVRQMVMYGLI